MAHQQLGVMQLGGDIHTLGFGAAVDDDQKALFSQNAQITAYGIGKAYRKEICTGKKFASGGPKLSQCLHMGEDILVPMFPVKTPAVEGIPITRHTDLIPIVDAGGAAEGELQHTAQKQPCLSGSVLMGVSS